MSPYLIGTPNPESKYYFFLIGAILDGTPVGKAQVWEEGPSQDLEHARHVL